MEVQEADVPVSPLQMNGRTENMTDIDLDQSSGIGCLNENESVASGTMNLVTVESGKNLDLATDRTSDKDVNDNSCTLGLDTGKGNGPSEHAPLVNGNGTESGNTDPASPQLDIDENSNTTKDENINPSGEQGGVILDGAAEDIKISTETNNNCPEKQDINGNSATQQDKNLVEKEDDSPVQSPSQGSNTSEASGATPIKRKTATPSNLPLSGNASRKSNSRKSSPSSPTQKAIDEQRRKPQSPGSSKNGGTKADVVSTPKNGGRSPTGENKFVLKRKASKSKLPVSSPQSPDIPKAKTIASESRADDKQTTQKKSHSQAEKNDGSSVVKCTPSKSTAASPTKDSPTPDVPVPRVTKDPASFPATPDVPATSTPIKKDPAALPQTPGVPVQTPRTEQKSKVTMTPRRLTEEDEAWTEKVKKFQELKMAMSEVNQDPRTKFLRCLFCTNLFSLNGREPRMLACCLNAICSACASKLCLESPVHLRCPVCRQNISLPQDRTSDSIDLTDESVVDGGLMDLPTEIIRTKIIEFQHIQKGLTFPCSFCTGKPLCTWFCENCDNYMCDQCREHHKEDTKSKRHSTIAIPTLKSRQLKDFKQHHYCKEHSFSKLTLYCTTCKQVVCSTCTRDGHERDTHNVLTIQEAFGARFKQAGKLLSKARKKHRHLSDYTKCLKAKSNCNEVSSNSARDLINETFDRLMDVMQHRRTELLAEVERESATLATSATVDTDSADCRLSMLNTATDFTKEFKSKADSIEFLQLFPTVSDTLRNVLDFSNDQLNTSRQGVVFSPWNLKTVETLLKTAGQLRVVTYKPTGRPGREEVNLKPAIHPEGHVLDTTTTIAGTAEGTRDVVCCPNNRVVMIPASEDRGTISINCPRLEFDLQTVHFDRTVTSEGAMINHSPERPLPETGCRLRSYPGAMADTALDGTGFQLWMVKTKVAIKQRVPDNKMLFEAALTGSPVDAPLSQRIDSSLVLAGCDLHHELCIKVKYCCKNLAHFSGCKNTAGTHADFRYGMLLDFDRRRLHVLDITNNTVIAKAERISVHKPLWSMFCVGRFTFADVKMSLDTADKVKVTPELFQLLTKIVDQERAK